jgi:hypothetical protein
MVVRPLTIRLLALLLSVVPTVWGNCPCWFTDARCCGSEDAGARGAESQPCCPHCARHGTSAPGEPARGSKRGCGGCEGCPSLAARYANSAAPAAVQMPDDGGGAAVVAVQPPRLEAPVLPGRPARLRVPWPGPSGAPAATDTTVLRF